MGTGVLVGPRHVLTSAHVLVSEKDPSKTVGSRLRVQPARNGDHQPFPEVKVRGWRVDPRWIRKVGAHWQVQARFDYGLVVLEKDVPGWKHPGLGECSLAYWGAPDICFPQTEVGLAADKVAGQDAWSAGYPGDREPGTMHGGAGQITYDNHKGVLMHTIDTYGGQSGAPIWIKRHGMWCLVGIHSRGGRWAVVGGRTVPTHNAAVLVSFDVLRQVEEWKRSFQGVTMREGSRFEHELLKPDLPGGGVIRLGRGETPPKPIRLSHFHVRKYLSSAGLLSDTSPGVMTPARMSPGYVDDARRARLQRELEALLRGSYAHALSPKVQLRVGLADLTEAKFHKPIFAGFASYGRPPAGQMEGASLVKILALYALYQLRFDLNHFAREQGITSGAALRTAIVKEWTKAGLTKAPAFTKLFQFVPGDPVQVKLLETPAIHENRTARVLIVRLGFEYIGSVALQSGLFDEASGGLWLNAAYEDPAVRLDGHPVPEPGAPQRQRLRRGHLLRAAGAGTAGGPGDVQRNRRRSPAQVHGQPPHRRHPDPARIPDRRRRTARHPAQQVRDPQREDRAGEGGAREAFSRGHPHRAPGPGRKAGAVRSGRADRGAARAELPGSGEKARRADRGAEPLKRATNW